MPQGYYSIEQWIEKLGKPGFCSVTQMQRVIWAEAADGGFKLRQSHALSPDGFEGMPAMIERSGGRYPREEVRAARRLAKARKARKTP